MASWQEKLTSLVARSSHIFSNGDMSDVTFVVGEPPKQKRFKLHKLILSMSSDVFFAMFHGSLPEMGEVKVPDIKPDIFAIMMKYVYEESLSVENVEQAIYTHCASEKYNISHLRDLCATYISENLSPENLPIFYRLPAILETLQIKSMCKTMLSENTSDVLTSENFAKAPLDMVKDIVQLEKLNVPNEENLFELVLKWAKSFCLKENPTYTKKALRAVMDHFLPHIRFLGMSADNFLCGPARSGVFTDSEIASISDNLVAFRCRDLPVWCNIETWRNKTYVFPLTDSHACIFITRQLSNSIKCLISIQSRDILFKGVIVYVPYDSDVLTARLKINKFDSTTRRIAKTKFPENECSYDAETSLLKCMLLKPFPLSMSEVYHIYLSSPNKIFGLCTKVHSGTSTRRNQDFEMEYTLLDTFRGSKPQPACAHFYQIIYSNFKQRGAVFRQEL